MHIALHVNQPCPSVTDMLKLLKEMQISATAVPASIFECVFGTPVNWFDPPVSKAHPKRLSSEENLGSLMEELEDMSLHSYDVFAKAICLSLLRVLTNIDRSASTGVKNLVGNNAFLKFVKLIAWRRVYFEAVETHLEILALPSSPDN